MRKILLSAILATGALTCWASGYNCLRVHLASGEKMDIMLRDDLRVSFSATHLQAESSDVNVEVQKTDILSFEHRHEEWSGVDDASVTAGGMSRQGDMLVFDGLPEGAAISLFDTSGKALRHAVASSEARIPLEGLAPGVYVVKAGDKSYKITIR